MKSAGTFVFGKSTPICLLRNIKNEGAIAPDQLLAMELST